MSEDKLESKELFVGDKIIEISKGTKRKPPYIKIQLSFPPYLDCCNKDVDSLLDKLMKQQLDMFSEVPIRGLTLKWNELIEDAPEAEQKGV